MLLSSIAVTARTSTAARSRASRIAPSAAILPGSGRSPARKDSLTFGSNRKLSSGVTVNASGFDALISKLIPKGNGDRAPDAAERADLPAPAPGVVPAPGMKLATFAGGCFWGVELAYQRVPGVTKTAVGYCQGQTVNPTYEQVCSGRTGHTEAVLVEYDPKEVDYVKLVELLWTRIDPTQVNGQGNDWGTQYRTGIYYHDEEQKAIAVDSRKKEEERIGRTIATEILPAAQWYNAEKYHQQYLAKGGRMGRAQSAAKGCTDPIRCYG